MRSGSHGLQGEGKEGVGGNGGGDCTPTQRAV